MPGHPELAMGAIASGGVQVYRGGRRAPIVRGRTVILVDDGLATGSSMQAAVLALRQQSPARIVVAVPVGARDTCERLRRIADEVMCAVTPEPFTAVGLWYEDFSQTTDEDVRRFLAEPANPQAVTSSQSSETAD